jgi:hypothetical protein
MGGLTEVQLKAIGGHDERRKHEPRDNQQPGPFDSQLAQPGRSSELLALERK